MSSSKNRVDKKLFEEIFKKGKTLKGKYFLLRFFPIDKNQKKNVLVTFLDEQRSELRYQRLQQPEVL